MLLYPAIDIRGGRCVRLVQGRDDAQTRYHDDPVEPARRFAEGGASWIHVVDLDGAFDGAPRNLGILRQIAALGPKVQFGGGLRDRATVEAALEAGASRVIVGTRAAADRSFLAEVAGAHGARLAVGIDAKEGRVAVRGWKDVTEVRAEELAKAAADLGAGTVIFTDIATDGMLSGPNWASLESMLGACPAKVIASGGVAGREDVARLARLARTRANLEGAIVGKALYEGRATLAELLEAARTGA
jgi:phosphoribosylformimino-5-aminoimidazole carboxamide ribotide isomerase